MKGSLASMLCRPVYRVLLRNVSFGRIDEKVLPILGMNVKGRMIYLSERIVMRSDIPANKPPKLINSGERGCAETVLFPHNLFI